MNCFKGFGKTISFLFYIFEIYVQLFLRNTLFQILLIESIFHKKIDEWYFEWQRVTISDNEWYNEWERVTTTDEWCNERQRVTAIDSERQQITISDGEWQEKKRS